MMAVTASPTERRTYLKMGRGLLRNIDMDKENYQPLGFEGTNEAQRLKKRRVAKKSRKSNENQENIGCSLQGERAATFGVDSTHEWSNLL